MTDYWRASAVKGSPTSPAEAADAAKATKRERMDISSIRIRLIIRIDLYLYILS